jgi:cytochrome P450
MPLVADLELPVLDYTDPELRGPRFHAAVRAARERSWLARSPLAYFALDRESASFFLRTRSATFPGMKIAELFGIDDGPLYEEMRHNVLHLDGEVHSRLRNAVNPAFTPRATERWRGAMRGFLEELWAAVAPDGRCELVEAFAKPYPSLTIATVMGAPLADAPRLHRWSNLIQRQFDPLSLMEMRPEIEAGCVEFDAYCQALLDDARDREGDDLASVLAGRLGDVEAKHLILNVLLGAVDTTQSQLAHGVRLFAEHPEQWARLAEDPGLVPRAVEEILRFEPVTPFTARLLREDVEHRGVTFPAGTIVMVAAVAANREGADGERFDAAAERADRPLTFGAGVHYCLGANLARAELQEALRFLAPRMRGLELDGEPAYGTVQGIYGLDALPVRWRAG